MTPLLEGFGLAGFRSFAPDDITVVGPLGKVNLLAGQNNAGKSNVLRFLELVGGRSSGEAVNPLDVHQGRASDRATRFAVAVRLSDEDVFQRFDTEAPVPGHLRRSRIVEAFRSPLLRRTEDDLLWVEFAVSLGSVHRNIATLEVDERWLQLLYESLTTEQRTAARSASSAVASRSGGAPTDDLRRIVQSLKVTEAFPSVESVSAFRRIEVPSALNETTAGSHDGRGLIDSLARLDRPAAGRQEDREQFEAIQGFVRSVLDDPSVVLEVPYDRTTINVRMGSRVLPIEHLGTGVHEVVILAAAATVLRNTLVCIEEPEIHLHPLLQRKLVRYLAEQTDNQYLIATHSAHMLDAEVAAIFHVDMTQGASAVTPALLPAHRAALVADLGYRASDLVQANAVIWVEGPSDRIYVRRWLELQDPSLVEGVHYSIMFYGGRLLSHLSSNDDDVEDFISLRRLNRHVAILIDSDKVSARKGISATKQRVRDALDAGPGLAWVTDCNTIENYVPAPLLTEVIAELYAGAVMQPWERWTNPLSNGRVARTGGGSTKSVDVDKVSIARTVAERWTDETERPFDLTRKVSQLAHFVRTANGWLD